MHPPSSPLLPSDLTISLWHFLFTHVYSVLFCFLFTWQTSPSRPSSSCSYKRSMLAWSLQKDRVLVWMHLHRDMLGPIYSSPHSCLTHIPHYSNICPHFLRQHHSTLIYTSSILLLSKSTVVAFKSVEPLKKLLPWPTMCSWTFPSNSAAA